jgi:hypothetical protein
MLLGNDTKKILAHCLATENIKIIYNEKAKTPSFDSIKRKLTLPNWVVSENIENLVVAHEMAHALFSNLSKKEIKFFEENGFHLAGKQVCEENPHVGWSYYQIIEDIRSEKLMKRKYKGINRDFTLGYAELMEEDFFGLRQNHELTLIDKLNVYFKARYSCPVPFSFNEEELNFVEMCETVETSDDVLSVAKKVFEYCKQKKEQEKKDNQNDNSVGENKSKNSDNSELVTEGSSEAVSSDSNEVTPDTKMESPVTQRMFDYVLSTKVDLSENPNYYHCPKCIELPIVGYKKLMEKIPPIREKYMDLVTQYMKSCQESVNVMMQEFMRRKAAKEYQKIKIHKTGTLNCDKLSQYKISEDIFKKIKDVKKGKSHALILCVDWSSSMIGNLSDTMDQLYRIVLFCRKMNIPHEVYLFTDNSYYNSDFPELFERNTKHKVDVDMIGIKMKKFSLFNIFSSKMTNMEFKMMLYSMKTQVVYGLDRHSSYNTGGTPLDECIVAMNKLIPEYQKNNKIEIMNVIFLTDGDSDSKEWGNKETNSYIYYNKKNYRIRVSATNTLLKILKKETGANVFGIYLHGDAYGDELIRTSKYLSRNEEEKIKEQELLKDNGYFAASNKVHGYDKLFVVMSGRRMDTVVDSFDNLIDSSADKYGAFHLYMIAKSFKSLMLKHFIQCTSDHVD